MSKLYRSRRDKKVTGLCGGLAEMMNVDATLLRLLVVIATFFSGGAVIFIYVIASLVIPKEPGFDPPPGGPYGDPYGAGNHYDYGQGGWWGCKSNKHGGHYSQAGNHSDQGYGGGQGYGAQSHSHNAGYARPQADDKKSNIDEVMKDIERKAMYREIEELKAKVAEFEKKQKGDV